MFDYSEMLDFAFDYIKKLFYPEEWIGIDLELSKSEIFTILLVDRHGEIIMSQVSDYINVPMSTATGIVDRLVKNSYLKRERSGTDRRLVVIKLTDNGKGQVDRLKSTMQKYIKMVYDALTDEERELIYGVFLKVVKIIENKNADEARQLGENMEIKKINIE